MLINGPDKTCTLSIEINDGRRLNVVGMALPDVCKIKASTERQKKVPGLGVTAAIYPENANPDEDKALTKTVRDFSGSPYPKRTVLEARIGPEDVRIEVVGAQYLPLNPDEWETMMSNENFERLLGR